MKLIRLKKLIEVLQTAHDKYNNESVCESISVEFWLGDQMVELDRIGQFGIVPDVTITLKPPPATSTLRQGESHGD